MSLDVYLAEIKPIEVYWANITHNLNKMADEANLYDALWRPEEIEVTTAEQLIPILEEGLSMLLSNPEYFEQFNPSNGWGDYKGLVSFTERYLSACEAHPYATISVSR